MKSNKVYIILTYINNIYIICLRVNDIGIIIIVFYIKKMKDKFEDIK